MTTMHCFLWFRMMRLSVFEYEAWVMLLAFPMDHQTEHYVNKAVSTFGKLLHWYRPGIDKARVLVKVYINDIAQVSHSLVVKRIGQLAGIGRSWSVPVYVLNGRHTIPGLVGNEDPVPPMNASPHPYELPYLTPMQQFQLEQQQHVQQQIQQAWDQQAQMNEPEEQTGFSLRDYLRYEGPSLMDGVTQSNNVTDDPTDEWSIYSDIAEAADDFINGRPNSAYQFIRAGRDNQTVLLMENPSLLRLIG